MNQMSDRWEAKKLGPKRSQPVFFSSWTYVPIWPPTPLKGLCAKFCMHIYASGRRRVTRGSRTDNNPCATHAFSILSGARHVIGRYLMLASKKLRSDEKLRTKNVLTANQYKCRLGKKGSCMCSYGMRQAAAAEGNY